MKAGKIALLITVAVAASTIVLAQATESSVSKQLENLRSVPDAKRPAATAKLAEDIRSLPAGQAKVKLADDLSHLSTEGDPGQATIQAVADTLAQALKETPQHPGKQGPAEPYAELARLVRYEGATTTLDDPQLTQAAQTLVANDADAAKADFTLKDLKGKKVTLSALKGKIVLVNFWATWCPPCRKEMADLDLIESHYAPQGLVILSLTNENPFTVSSFMSQFGQYHPDILLDDGGKVAKEFHVTGLPKTYVYDRDGKLVAVATDMRTQMQFFRMLAKAGLQPN